MSAEKVPFNISLMELTKERLQRLRPVTTMDYFVSAGGELHPDGLFSPLIFGRQGDETRFQRFSYIDVRLPIFHPIYYQRLVALKAMYKGIMNGTVYARWDDQLKDFVATNELEGRTGFSFFMETWDQIVFQRNESPARSQRIDLVMKFKDRATTTKVLVMPAGLRDIEIGDDGRAEVAEVNGFYRKLLAISNTVPPDARPARTLDRPQMLLQQTFNEVYDYIETLLSGKHGFLQSKWGSRHVFNGTRNVITSDDTTRSVLNGPDQIRHNDTILGLRQASRALLPKIINALRGYLLDDTFSPGNGYAQLIDPNTLRRETVIVSPQTLDRWSSSEGLEKVIASYGEIDVRDQPVMLDNYYLALIYAPEDRKVFRVLKSVEELPESIDPKEVRPINYMELLYLCMYQRWRDYAVYVTRYPVTGPESCYPSMLYVKTTMVGQIRRELDEQFQELPGDEHLALEFPTYGEGIPGQTQVSYMDSMVPHPSRLAGLNGD